MSDIDELTSEIDDLKVNDAVERKNWNHLPFEMKEMVVKEMDIVTRTRLKMCSKADKYLVESVPLRIHKISAFQHEYDDHLICGCFPFSPADEPPEYEFETDHLLLKIDSLFVASRKNRVIIKKFGRSRFMELETEKEATNMVKQMFVDIVLTKKHEIERFRTNWEFDDIFKSTVPLIKTKEAAISCYEEDDTIQWLKLLSPGVDSVYLHHFDREYDTPIENDLIPIVWKAKRVDLQETKINDIDLLKFKATDLTIDAVESEKGINQLIKKWIKEDYPVGSKFELVRDNPLSFRHPPTNVSALMARLQHKIMRSDESKTEIEIDINGKKYMKMAIDHLRHYGRRYNAFKLLICKKN